MLCIGKALLLLLKSVQAAKINPVIFPQQHNPFQPSKTLLRYLQVLQHCSELTAPARSSLMEPDRLRQWPTKLAMLRTSVAGPRDYCRTTYPAIYW